MKELLFSEKPIATTRTVLLCGPLTNSLSIGLLVASAALSAWHLWAGGTTSIAGWSLPRSLAALHAGGEMLLAAWLLLPGPIWRNQLLSLMFATYAGVNAWALLHGAEHCGCFGDVPVPVEITLGIDAVLAVGWMAPVPPLRRPWVAAVLVVVAVLGTVVLLTLPPRLAGQAPATAVAAAGLRRLNDIPELATGRWTVVLYRDTCPHCQRDLRNWVESVRFRPAGHRGGRWAFVGVGRTGGHALLDDLPLPDGVPCWRIDRSEVAPLPCALVVESGSLLERIERAP